MYCVVGHTQTYTLSCDYGVIQHGIHSGRYTPKKESLKKMKITAILVVVLVLSLAAAVVAEVGVSKVDPMAAANGSLVVTVSASGTPVKEVLTSLAAQSKQKIIVETSVKGSITSPVKESSIEAALTSVCKSARLVWRKVYIDPKSELLEKPDRLASTLRLLTGMSFPDMVVAGSSTSKLSLVCQQKQTVEGAQEKIVKDLGMEPVYLVSNDLTIAARDDASASVKNYSKMAKDQLDLFMKMTPEEREQALLESLNMMDQMGPEYYASLMQTMMNSNPESLRRLQARQTDMLFQMPADVRRQMIRMNFEVMKNITPEQQKLIQEDAKAVMEEMQKAGQAPGN